MPKDVSAHFKSAIADTDTEPEFLIYIGVGSGLRFSTGKEITWGLWTWLSYGASVQWDRNGLPTVILPNFDTSGTQLLRANDLLDKPLTIYLYYAPEGRDIFQGFLNLSSVDYKWSKFTGSYTRMAGSTAPGRRVVGPEFTHRLVPGTKLEWAGSTKEVTSN